MTPNDLLNAILQAPVDLLWNGGIGTYVRASTETDVQVGDKANDAIRVTGRNCGARSGEGGNLGFTQLDVSRPRTMACSSTPMRSTTRRC